MKPKTVKGKEKLIGVWDFEGVAVLFKTLGAKRYLTGKIDKQGNLHGKPTVSGINKENLEHYLLEEYGLQGMFDAFDDNLSYIYLDI